MKVSDRMTPDPYTISPDSTVGEAWRLMNQHKHTHLPVVERQKVLGIITLKDLGSRPFMEFFGNSHAARYFSSEQENILFKVKVRDVMQAGQVGVTIGQEAYIEQAAKLLLENKLSGLPVVDDDGNLVGIITQTDILSAFLDLLAINSPGTRINLRVDENPENLALIGQILSRHQVHIENLVTMKTNHDAPLMILRLDTTNAKTIISDLKAAGFKVESTLIKQ